MNIYVVKTGYGDHYNHCVVAESMADVERIFVGKYWPTTIKSIELFSMYV